MGISIEIEDDSLDNITDYVLESEAFAESVVAFIETNIGNSVTDALANENIDGQVEKAVEAYTEEIENRFEKLEEENAELKEELREMKENFDEQIHHILNAITHQQTALESGYEFTTSILRILGTIPIIRRWFK